MNYPSTNAGQFAASWVENLELARSRPHRRALFRRRRLFSSRPSLCVPIGHRPLRTTLCFPGSSRKKPSVDAGLNQLFGMWQ